MSAGADFGTFMRAVSLELLGEPNARLSSKDELRFGKNGSLSVDLKSGTWFDHETKKGGGVKDLIERQTGRANGEAVEWLREQGFPINEPAAATRSAAPALGRIVATYDYVDENGDLVFQAVRYEPKTFRQRRKPTGAPDEKVKDGWVWSVKGIRQVPYRLPDLTEAIALEKTIFIVEGEKDADNLWAVGVPATCNAMGAGKWPASLGEFFRGADVIHIPDNDDAGRNHTAVVGAALKDVATRQRVLDLPGLAEKGDVSDWLANGGTSELLYQLVDTRARAWGTSVAPSRFSAVWFADIDSAPPHRDWIVKGLLAGGEMSVMWGYSGSGKSFIGLDLGLSISHVATRSELDPKWFGYRLYAGGVVYVAPEGGQDLRLRIRAWREARGIPQGTVMPFVLFPSSVDLVSTEGDTGALIAEINAHAARMSVPLRVVFVDTLARAMAGRDENSSSDMGAFIKNCERIQKETGAHVIAIHHAGNDRSKERGHTSLRGSVDTSIEVSKPDDGGPNVFSVRKMKGGVEGAAHQFRLKQIPVGVDAEGDAITSCVVDPSGEPTDTARRGRRAKPLSREARLGLRALHDALADHGEPAPTSLQLPYGTMVVERKYWRPKLLARLVEPDEDTGSDKVRQRLRRVRIELEDARVIAASEPYFWIVREPSQ